MKKSTIIVALLIICLSGYFTITAEPASRLYGIKKSTVDWVRSIGVSKADYQEQLNCKTAELKQYEQALAWADEEVRKLENTSGPVCPMTGTSSKFTVTEDPRDKMILPRQEPGVS